MAIFGTEVPSTGDPGAAAPPAEVTAPASEGAPASPPVDAAPAPPPAAPNYIDTEAMGGHLVKVRVDGSDVEMPLKDALQGVMMQKDYTRKTQELSEVRRRLGQADALAAALDADPIGTLKQLAEAYDIDPGDGFQQAEPDPVRDQLRAQQAQLNEMRNSTVQQQIASEVNNLKTQYGEFDVQATADYAVEHRMTLTNAYKAMNFDSVRGQSQPSTAEQNRQRALAAQNVEGGANAQTGAVTAPTKPAQSFREAYFQAKKSLGG